MRRSVIVAGLLWPLAAGAGVYKWVDADGKVHFGDGPPSGSNAQEVAVKDEKRPAEPAPADEVDPTEKLRRFSNAYEEEQLEKKEAARKAQERADTQRRACAEARDALERYKHARYLYEFDKKGNKVILDEKQRAQSQRELEAAVQKHCTSR